MRPIVRATRFSAGQKLLLLTLNGLPLVHLLGTFAVVYFLPTGIGLRSLAGLGVFFVLPPLLTRIVLMKPLRFGHVVVPSDEFFRWWACWQFQGVFNRVPWIEECLRFVPGLYSFWLRLWGAKVGRLTLWSPGVRIFDRPLVCIGNGVVIGLDVRMSGHFGGLDANGDGCMTLGVVAIDDGCTIGAGAFLGPGVHLEPNQFTEVLFLGAPFARWRAGARVSPENSTHPSSNP